MVYFWDREKGVFDGDEDGNFVVVVVYIYINNKHVINRYHLAC